MDRISYRCNADEMKLPLGERKTWNVFCGNENVATIASAEDPSSDRSHALRIWNARMHNIHFDPFDFPHAEDDSDEKVRPHIKLENGKPTLVNPQLMTMKEARSWVKQVLQRTNENG